VKRVGMGVSKMFVGKWAKRIWRNWRVWKSASFFGKVLNVKTKHPRRKSPMSEFITEFPTMKELETIRLSQATVGRFPGFW